MTPQEWLVKWMELKSDFADYPQYFVEEDRKFLLELSDDNASRILTEVYKHYHPPMDWYDYIWSGMCAFCYITNSFRSFQLLEYDVECRACPYGKRHGVCDKSNSDYMKFSHRFSASRKLFNLLDNHLDLIPEVLDEFIAGFANSRLTPGSSKE